MNEYNKREGHHLNLNIGIPLFILILALALGIYAKANKENWQQLADQRRENRETLRQMEIANREIHGQQLREGLYAMLIEGHEYLECVNYSGNAAGVAGLNYGIIHSASCKCHEGGVQEDIVVEEYSEKVVEGHLLFRYNGHQYVLRTPNILHLESCPAEHHEKPHND